MDPHVDDGRLNALLDGELDAAERGAVEAHLAACAGCRARYEEARRFLAGATDLLGFLDAPAVAPETPEAAPPTPDARAPGVKPAATVREEAIVLPGPGVARTARERAVDPAARIAKTAKEKAVDPAAVAGLPPTTEVPALPADLPEESAESAPGVRPIFTQVQHVDGQTGGHRRMWGVPPLAWAAMLVVGIGGALMARSALRPARPAMDVTTTAPPLDSAPGAVAAPAPAAGAGERTQPARTQARTPLVKPRTMRGEKAPTPEEAASRIPRDRPAGAARRDEARDGVPGADMAGPAGALAAANGRATRPAAAAGAGAAAPPAPSPAAAATPIGARAARAPAALAQAPAAAATAPPTFQLIDFDEAVRRLSGSVRLIDGMQPSRVEVGPGLLVAGAAPDREVIRIHYTDHAGRALVLDQQPGEDAGAASVNGLMRGDTLVTAQPDGSVRVRWVDRKSFWLSLTGAGGPDSVRMLVERIR